MITLFFFKNESIRLFIRTSLILAHSARFIFLLVILIKNKKVGKAGKGMLYCTSEEAKEAHLTIDDLDLDKVWQELSPFIQYVTPEIKEACKILAKDDKALKKLADDYCNVEEPERLIVMPEAKENYKTMIESSGFEKGLIIDEPKKQRGRPKKNNE